jgi:NDP-sugar pyrophosphorylase family protein
LALTTVEDPSRYGVARLKGRRILGFEEKPAKGKEPSRLINAGTYIFDPEIFSHLDADSLEEVFEQLASQSSLSGYIYGGKWKDIDE